MTASLPYRVPPCRTPEADPRLPPPVAKLSAVSDPNIVHDINAKRGSLHVYPEHEVDAAAAATVTPGKDRFNKR